MEQQLGGPPPPAPLSVAIESSRRRLSVAWEEGHDARYPWWLLRGFCPCAGCQGHGGPFTFHPRPADAPAGRDMLDDVLEVGHYALNLTWQDGHKTGIYAFDLLRRLCLCADCRPAAAPGALWAQLDEAARQRWTADTTP